VRDKRRPDELRPVRITKGFLRHAEGSALVEFGGTQVLCACSVDDRVPPFRRESGEGWLTAEYALLPRSTSVRTAREVGRGGPSGRTHEIQRLIGRSLRAVVDMAILGPRTLLVDADVIEADGGTRTAAITGSFVAVVQACAWLLAEGAIPRMPIEEKVAAVSVGIREGQPLLDLEYEEDLAADVDMNVAMTSGGRFVEVQGTAEGTPFSRRELDVLLALADTGIRSLFAVQDDTLGPAWQEGTLS